MARPSSSRSSIWTMCPTGRMTAAREVCCMIVDGRPYVATRLGVQVFDHATAAPVAILRCPQARRRACALRRSEVRPAIARPSGGSSTQRHMRPSAAPPFIGADQVAAAWGGGSAPNSGCALKIHLPHSAGVEFGLARARSGGDAGGLGCSNRRAGVVWKPLPPQDADVRL